MQKVQIILVDDIDGGDATETISFSIGRDSYELDLSEANVQVFQESMERWTKVARKVGRASARRSSRRPTRARAEANAEVREWASREGMDVAERGRIPESVQDAYENATATA